MYNCNILIESCNKPVEVFTYNKTGTITILILGGIHGNEPAGSISIINLIDDLNNNIIELKNIKLILIPKVNYCALNINKRQMPYIGDLNRKFPTSVNFNRNDLHPIIKQIVDLIDISDFILDFHEGWGFHRENNNSIGSTITPNTTTKSLEITNILYNNINAIIEDPLKKFQILTHNEDLIKSDPTKYSHDVLIETSLRYYVSLINKDYILIETSGQNDIQPLETRTNQNKIFIRSILNALNNG